MTEQNIEELIHKYAEGKANEEEIKILMDWYDSASVGEVRWPASHVAEKDEVYHRMLGRLQTAIIPKRSVVYFPLLRVAAILILVAGASLLAYFFNPFSTNYYTVNNPAGQIKLVLLPDSSQVWLNASSTLSYAKSFATNRTVTLEGEGYFEVRHDSKHPFRVDAGGIKTTVLGTSFNIKAYKSAAKTTVSLISGKIKVDDDAKVLAILSPSSQLEYDRKNNTSKTKVVEVAGVSAWKHGTLQFQGETLGEIAAALERWYNVRIEFSNTGISDCRYYMSFENNIPLKDLLKTLGEVTEMTFKSQGRVITISGRPCR